MPSLPSGCHKMYSCQLSAVLQWVTSPSVVAIFLSSWECPSPSLTHRLYHQTPMVSTDLSKSRALKLPVCGPHSNSRSSRNACILFTFQGVLSRLTTGSWRPERRFNSVVQNYQQIYIVCIYMHACHTIHHATACCCVALCTVWHRKSARKHFCGIIFCSK